MEQPSAMRDAVRLVVKSIGPQFVEVGNQISFEQFGMKLRDSINGVAADNRQVCHSNLFEAAFLNKRHTAQTTQISRPAIADELEKPAIDLIDDLQVSRQHALNE